MNTYNNNKLKEDCAEEELAQEEQNSLPEEEPDPIRDVPQPGDETFETYEPDANGLNDLIIVEKVVHLLIKGVRETLKEMENGIEYFPYSTYRRILNKTLGPNETFLDYLNQTVNLLMSVKKFKREAQNIEQEKFLLNEADTNIINQILAWEEEE
jgi:hypothetical protein